ncbi:M23 family metallopeptidase [Desulfovibrio inopinatus]|uniref:M23 family metallopeptidase n=1 Tax=Desulfovibrio inopinatus TaxID=102109 RepID=UPI00146FAAC4|nr:peptidoglycan DD-metalloendopeptidase family protein [Desulfovibrio inopinatus]
MKPKSRPLFGAPPRRAPFLRILLVCAFMGVGLVAAYQAGWFVESEPATCVLKLNGPEVSELFTCPPSEEEQVPKHVNFNGVVKPGDTAAQLLGSYLDAAQLHTLAAQSRKVYPLSQIRIGKEYTIEAEGDTLTRFEYEIGPGKTLIVALGDDGYQVDTEIEPSEVRTERVSGSIRSSLIQAVNDSGENTKLAVKIANVFSYDIDFCKDIRRGDTFEAVVEKRYRGGQFVGYGRVLATRFSNQGEVFEGFYYEDGKGNAGYYDALGKARRKMFLKAPLDFTRISSGFTHSRLHPIFKKKRPHLGVDYAAPTGTPVWSIGDGVVVKKAYGKGYGYYVTVRHNSVYTTQYNHLSRFPKGLAVGKKVKQGQVIGFVGSTGWATGPHLDFRLYKNGQAINALKLKKTTADPISKRELASFKKKVHPLLSLLDNSSRASSTRTAKADTSTRMKVQKMSKRETTQKEPNSGQQTKAAL